ncbi:Arrestin domain-containing protein 3 [Orchesella cincta]|uniref:Arrestin domain-containing protein 3 n=1 Tax=Orchesella cincta TaxID=48709 RepID=A0A1D2NIU0_ORCCI|nr:Arrestin domain-containing protein 3 [Orchesella cincta]
MENRDKGNLLSIKLNHHTDVDSQSEIGENKLEGTVEVESKEDILVHGILLTVYAIVRTNILKVPKQDGKHKYSTTIHVESAYAFGNEADTRKLTKGKHSFPFTFCLPQHLPSSFDGIYGTVKYLISAKTHSNNERNDEMCNTSQPVQIKRYLDLADGIAYGKTIKFSSRIECPKKSLRTKYTPSLKYVFEIHKTGFATGESIPFVLNLSNPDRRQIASITVVLTKKTTYGDLKYHTEVLDEMANVSSTEVNNTTSLTWVGNLQVPQTAVPTHSIQNKKSPIFSHQYFLHVKLVPSVGHCIDGNLPIVIGTTKYECRGRRQIEHCVRSSAGSDLKTSFGESLDLRRNRSMLPSYSQTINQSGRTISVETLPPSYEEAVKMGRPNKSILPTPDKSIITLDDRN